MSNRIKLVQNDTRPDIIVALQDRDTDVGIDVSAAGTHVYMNFQTDPCPGTVLATITGTKLPGSLDVDGNLQTNPTTPGAGGRVKFSWVAGVLDVDPGQYAGVVYISFADGTTQTMFDTLKFVVRCSC